MNLEFSYGVNKDNEFDAKGLQFLGAGRDENEEEVHVWLKEGFELPIEEVKEEMKWQAKPDREGYYLMRSGDASSWTASRYVKVQGRQEYLSMAVILLNEDGEAIGMACVDDYSEYVDWLFFGKDIASTEITEDEHYRLVFLPKVKEREWEHVCKECGQESKDLEDPHVCSLCGQAHPDHPDFMR